MRAFLTLACIVAAVDVSTVNGAWSNATQQTTYMRRAIALAKLSDRAPYGAVIVDPSSASIVAEGKNDATHDPSRHAEMVAITNLSTRVPNVRSIAPRLEFYITAEPCPMCSSAMAWAGFGRIIWGTSIPFLEARGLPQIGIRATDVIAAANLGRLLNHSVEIIGGVLANETDRLPYVPGE